MAHLGIDLGTSNTLVAYLEAHMPVVCPIRGSTMIPSYVYIQPSEVLVGKEALDVWADPRGSHDLAFSFHSWKPMMGEQKELATLRFGDKLLKVTPEYLTQCMVKYIVRNLTAGDLGNTPIESILVTVPHGWRRENPERCRATRQAVQEAVKDTSIRVSELTVSEPVAAAVYWIWEARQRGLGQTLEGKTALICDVGGGTFDLSLIAIKGEKEPLEVVDAINNNIAGDYMDALLLARVCQEFNKQFKVDYPTKADDILNQLPKSPLLRSWYLKVREQKQLFSENFAAAKPRNISPRPVEQTFKDDAERTLMLSLSLQEFESCAQPFYQAGRELVRQFLNSNKDSPPDAVLLAGGGSKMAGLQEHILAPALRDFFQDEQRASAVLNRISVNRGQRVEAAVALGAALVANGVVNVQERLLNDIGLTAYVPLDVARRLNLPMPGGRAQSATQYVEVLISPILRRGTPLPARFSSSSLPHQFRVLPGSKLTLQLVIDDGSDNPWVQCFELSHERGKWQENVISWEIIADTDGVLTLQLKPKGSSEITITTRLERYYNDKGKAGIIIVPPQPLPPRVSFEQLDQLAAYNLTL